MNRYKKFAPNVFIAVCDEKHENNDIVTLTTKYGRENDVTIWKFIKEVDGEFYHSILPKEGYAAAKIEKLKSYQSNAYKKSSEFYDKSNKDKDFLSLGEPIKVGHHSEGRHRKIIEQANNNMRKSVELTEKADSYEARIEYWEKKSKEINLSQPESLEYFIEAKAAAVKYHTGLKNKTIEHRHQYSVTYAKKKCNDLAKKVSLARVLWEL